MRVYLAIIASITMLFSSCAKEGLDGDAVLAVKPSHHGQPIPSLAAYPDSVFVKFGAKDVPADPTHDYDALFVGTVGEDHIHCAGFKWGYYSIYVAGWDSTINQRVVGGVTTKIKRADRNNEITLEVPLTED